MDIESAQVDLGQSIFDQRIIDALGRFCGYGDGMYPEDLPLVERALRAFLTGKTLIVSRLGSFEYDDNINHAKQGGSLKYHLPFDDHLLDYEFLLPEQGQLIGSIGIQENVFLERSIAREIRTAHSTVLPKWISTHVEREGFFKAWFKGYETEECEAWAHDARIELLEEQSWITEELEPFDPLSLPACLESALKVARYLVGCQRAGAIVYADSRISSICLKFIFQEWPEYLFSSLDDEYRSSAARINGPGIFFTIPPLTKLVLSRASMRKKIPSVLVEMREEYASGRQELWEIIGQAYFARTENEQRRALAQLDQASKSLFGATWPQKMDALSMALTAAPLTPGALVGLSAKLLDHNRPRAQVAGISFARRLAKDLQRDLLNSREVIKRHFSHSEQKAFGFI